MAPSLLGKYTMCTFFIRPMASFYRLKFVSSLFYSPVPTVLLCTENDRISTSLASSVFLWMNDPDTLVLPL